MTINRLPLLLALISLSSSFTLLANTCDQRWEAVIDQASNQDLAKISDSLIGVCDTDLKDQLQQITERGHHPLRYSDATKLMYKSLDLNDGQLCSVYNQTQCNLQGEKKEFRINCEHTWPKSLGASGYPAVSDLHHLYPAEKDVNNRRANLPFCEVTSIEWTDGESKIGMGQSSETCFEPPRENKGNVARSMFYFATRYQHTISKDEEEVLRRWNQLDPVDRFERARNQAIQEAQGNRNPFVDLPQLVDLIQNF